jgi:DNA-binding response OmpR family regulator
MENARLTVIMAGLDPRTIELVGLGLRFRWPNARVIAVDDIHAALDSIEETAPDIILLEPRDLRLPLEHVLERVRSVTDIPLIVISPEPNEVEMLKSFELGADDYVRDSSTPMEMASRVFALLRRQHKLSTANRGQPVSIGSLVISPSTYEAFIDGQPLSLTATEFRLLHLLSKNRGTVVSNEFLERTLWGDRADSSASLKKYIQRVRRKLGDDPRRPQWIYSVRGVGYRFAPQGNGVHRDGAAALAKTAMSEAG